MRVHPFRVAVAVIALASPLAAAPPVAGGAAVEEDRATLRRQAIDEWYNETATKGNGRKKLGGPFSASYLKFLNQAAERERRRWADQLPVEGAAESSMGSYVEVAASGSNWSNIGPTKADVTKNGGISLAVSDSGRVRSIVPDPSNADVVYVAFAAGGVWKTTDGGSTWAPLTDSLGTLSCGSLAMDPSNNSTLYLGLGDPFDGTGIGLVKSTDGGSTWSSPVYLGSSTVIPQVLVAPANPSIVLAATDKGLFRSTNGGASFGQVALATGQAGAPYVWSLASTGGTALVLTLEANPLATAGTTDGQIWHSNDNGATWTRSTGVTKSTGVGRMTVASAPSSPTTLYAMAAIPLSGAATDLADIFKSTNGGVSFSALAVTKKRYGNGTTEARNVNTLLNGQGWYNQLVIVNPSNANTAYFGGALLIARTTDGGSSYRQLTNWLAQFGLPYVHADMHAAAFGPSGTFYVGSDGGIFKSSDAGTTWTNLNVGITTHLLYSVGSSPANVDAVIGGLQDNGTRVRSGATTVYNQYIGGDGFGSDVNRVNASTMLGSLYYARIQKSTNGGTSFTQSCSGITECGTSNAPFLTRLAAWTGDATGNTVFTHSNTKVYRSTNYAGTWASVGATGLPTTSFAIRNVAVAHSSSSRLGIAASGGRVYLSSNGGANWALAGTLPNNDLSISYVHFDTVDPNIVYAASVAPNAAATHLWVSTNFGASWTSLEGAGFPTGIPVNTIENDPGDTATLYAGTHLGVYRSTDGGATWSRFGSGMPLVNVTDLYISPSSSLVRAASYGRGFWELQ